MLLFDVSGNHRIYEIVSQGFYELRIDMTDFAGQSRYAVYNRFSIGDESSGYKLTIEDYQGTAGLIFHNFDISKLTICCFKNNYMCLILKRLCALINFLF